MSFQIPNRFFVFIFTMTLKLYRHFCLAGYLFKKQTNNKRNGHFLINKNRKHRYLVGLSVRGLSPASLPVIIFPNGTELGK